MTTRDSLPLFDLEGVDSLPPLETGPGILPDPETIKQQHAIKNKEVAEQKFRTNAYIDTKQQEIQKWLDQILSKPFKPNL